ncbi:MAG: hypothetical protein IPK63_23350 [Candidatus Competibacteraceae bacterium]|nr:hypothetical protein [Candidatus Competibacteraceae bacterium]
MANGLDRLRAWACEGALPALADPLDRPVFAENVRCRHRLEHLFDPLPGGERRRLHALDLPPHLLPPP